MTKRFDPKISEKVTILELKLTGRIVAIYQDTTGVQYVVRYFYLGEALQVYFFADELEAYDAYAIQGPGFTVENSSLENVR